MMNKCVVFGGESGYVSEKNDDSEKVAVCIVGYVTNSLIVKLHVKIE